MISNFKIKNYKCFDDFELKNLGRINIFLGKNNVGKSTLLEALFGFACGENLYPLLNTSIFRIGRDSNLNQYNLIEKVLNTFNNREELEFSFQGELEEGTKRKYSYKINPGTVFGEINLNFNKNSDFTESKSGNESKSFFILNIKKDNEVEVARKINYPIFQEIERDVEPFLKANKLDVNNFKDFGISTRIYSFLKREPEKFKKFLEELNKSFENSIENIDMFPYPDGSPAPVSIKMVGKEYIPLYEFGEGMQKWFSLVGNQMIYKNYISCIEEIGDMLHPEAQGGLGYNLTLMAEESNNQIFGTTQSLEFIVNYLKSISENREELLKDIRVITLRKIDGKIKSRTLDGFEALDLLINNELELR